MPVRIPSGSDLPTWMMQGDPAASSEPERSSEPDPEPTVEPASSDPEPTPAPVAPDPDPEPTPATVEPEPSELEPAIAGSVAVVSVGAHHGVAEYRRPAEPATADPDPEPEPDPDPGELPSSSASSGAEPWSELASVASVGAIRVRIIAGPDGEPWIDVRRWASGRRYSGPTRRGLAIPASSAGALAEAIARAAELASVEP